MEIIENWAVNGVRVEFEKSHGWKNDGWVICECFGPDADAHAKLIAGLPLLIEALKKLSKLGNGDYLGNSIVNEIAIDALSELGLIKNQTVKKPEALF